MYFVVRSGPHSMARLTVEMIQDIETGWWVTTIRQGHGGKPCNSQNRNNIGTWGSSDGGNLGHFVSGPEREQLVSGLGGDNYKTHVLQ